MVDVGLTVMGGGLPTGILTFVFTDIEGSTSMMQRLGHDAFVAVLRDHNQVIRGAFSAGTEVSSEGDSFFYVFTSPEDALQAAADAQKELSANSWPDGGAVQVRIGLHTGEGRLGGDNYVGLDVNRASRISAAGHGGQVLISETTKTAGSGWFGDSSLRDLGVHRFKGLERAEHVYQLVIPGLAVDHPPIRSLDSRLHNLPSHPSLFIGREREARAVAELLENSRLVTLTGTGGTGKTRLATYVAARLVGRFEGGVVFVPLEGLHSPDLVLAAIVEQLGIQDDSVRASAAIAEHVRGKQTLLVLDNFEHLIPASEDVGRLLELAPEVRILVTSRAILRVRGEQVYPVPPLASSEAVDLFIARAHAADPTFTTSQADPTKIAALVERLESIPLAIELAAPRIRLFGFSGLVERVLELVDFEATLGPVDAPERQRTLEASIDWSYQLLDANEQSVLRHISVFDGGFVLAAAEQVAGEHSEPGVVAVIGSLLDNSLLQQRIVDGQARFSMVDSVRRFALKHLEIAGEQLEAEKRHAEYFADLALRAAPELEGPDFDVWLDRLTSEHDNIRAVVRRSLARRDPEQGLRTVGAAWRFYHRRGHLGEAQSALNELLALDGASLEAKSIGLNGLAAVKYWLGEYDAALGAYTEVLELHRGLGDKAKEADTLFALSTTHSFNGNPEEGARYAARAAAVYEEIGAADNARRALAAEGIAVWVSGDLREAKKLWEKITDAYMEAGDRAEATQGRMGLAAIDYQLGSPEQALRDLGVILDEMLESGDKTGTIVALETISSVVAALEPETALRLAGAAEALRSELGGGFSLASFGLPTARETASKSVKASEMETLLTEGSGLDLESAISLGLELTRS